MLYARTLSHTPSPHHAFMPSSLRAFIPRVTVRFGPIRFLRCFVSPLVLAPLRADPIPPLPRDRIFLSPKLEPDNAGGAEGGPPGGDLFEKAVSGGLEAVSKVSGSMGQNASRPGTDDAGSIQKQTLKLNPDFNRYIYKHFDRWYEISRKLFEERSNVKTFGWRMVRARRLGPIPLEGIHGASIRNIQNKPDTQNHGVRKYSRDIGKKLTQWPIGAKGRRRSVGWGGEWERGVEGPHGTCISRHDCMIRGTVVNTSNHSGVRHGISFIPISLGVRKQGTVKAPVRHHIHSTITTPLTLRVGISKSQL